MVPPMPTVERHARGLDALEWIVESEFPTVFEGAYDRGAAVLCALDGTGKRLRWDTNGRIDGSQDLDPRTDRVCRTTASYSGTRT